jgi:hypothetical protein
MTRPADGGGGYPNPLYFDFAAANDAISALNSMIQVLQVKTTQRRLQGTDALSLWTGPHADRFRGQFNTALDDAATLIGQCQAAISNINMMIGIAQQVRHQQENPPGAKSDGRPIHGPY